MENWESPVERAIREAQERGEFDNLPGTGKPLRSLGDPEREDPDWWVKRFAEREHLDLSGALSPPLALRKEAATFPASLLDLRTEAERPGGAGRLQPPGEDGPAATRRRVELPDLGAPGRRGRDGRPVARPPRGHEAGRRRFPGQHRPGRRGGPARAWFVAAEAAATVVRKRRRPDATGRK